MTGGADNGQGAGGRAIGAIGRAAGGPGSPGRPPIAPVALVIDRDAVAPVYRQIEAAIADGIRAGRLRPGMRLPPERTLAAQLGVDRTTVVAAYRNLATDGWVAPLVGRGTVIVGVPEPPTTDGRRTPALPRVAFPWDDVVTSLAGDDADLDELAEASVRPGTLSLSSGVPATEGYPIAEFRSLLGDALREDGAALLQYAPAEGIAALRQRIAAAMVARGAETDARRVLVCAGSQQGLYLLARSLVAPGDTVAVEAPTYVGAINVFRAADAHLVPLPRDRDGVDPGRLDALLARRPVRLIYLLPTFQNPTGETLSLARREAVLAVAARHGVPVIEDDPYGDLRYDGDPLPSLYGLSGPDGAVVYLSTFSKVLFPGFRVGWVCGAPALIERVRREKALVDLDSNATVQAAVAEYLALGLLDQHLDRVRPLYRLRRDALVDGLTRSGPLPATWRVPQGGFSLWVELGNGLRAADVLREAGDRGVTAVPGDVFHVDGGGRSALRLSFSALSPEELREAGGRLAASIRAAAGSRAGRPSGGAGRIV